MKKIGLVAWHLNEISGTNTVLRTLLHCLNTQAFEYWIVLKENLPADDSLSRHQLEKRGFRVDCFSLIKYQSRQDWLENVHHFFCQNGVDVALYFDINIPFKFKKKRRKIKSTKIISLIHDVMPLTLPDYYLDPLKYLIEKRKYKRAVQADRIITVSDYSKNEIIRHLKVSSNKINRIYNGVNELSVSMTDQNDRQDRKGILYLGDLRNRKNVYRLAQAYLLLPESIKSQHSLMIIGRGRLEKKITALFRKNRALGYLRLLGQYSSLELISDIFNSVYLFVFPSVMEGFGLPVIEAQRHHLPVICGKHSSLGEIGANSVYYADVLNCDDLKKKMENILQRSELYHFYANLGYRNSLRFTGVRMAEEYQEIFAEV